MNGTKILVVDDNPDIRNIAQELLEREGAIVTTAENGKVAIDLLSRDQLPDLIVLDLQMPEVDGVEFRRQQLRDKRIAKIPVVLFSTLIEEDSIQGLGFVGIITKGLPGQLIAGVKQALATRVE